MSINVTNGNYLFNGNPIGGAGLEGTQYILVQANGTDIENAQELQEAYDLAKTMSPDVDNRITVIVAPGNYNFGSSIFVMDTEHIDLVSLNGTMSIIFNSTDNDGTISVETGNTFIKGVDVLTKPFKIGHDLNSLVVENCKGGDNSFGYLDDGVTLTLRGTFIDCVAGNNSFGHRPNIGGSSQINLNINGTFTNCTAGNNSFGCNVNNQAGSPTTLSFSNAKFTNCKADNNSFGAQDSPTAGSILSFNFSNFINCESGIQSFGYTTDVANIQPTLNFTIFENCKAGDNSFNTGNIPLSISLVTFTNCVGGNFSFNGISTITGNFENCVGGVNSFGAFDTVSGVFINCTGGQNSFGVGGALTGKLYRCQLTDGTFETPTGSGKIILGIDGNDDVINLTA